MTATTLDAGCVPAAVGVIKPNGSSARSVRVLTFTSIFPNSIQPGHGTFVRERTLALSRLCDVRVVAPVPWVPPSRWLPAAHRDYARIPLQEHQESLVVDHPRFAVIPKVLKSTDGVLMAASSMPHLRSLRRNFAFDVIDAHWAYPDGVAGAALARYFGVPFALTVRGDDINVFGQEWGRRPFIRWALQQASVVIALSEDLKRRVRALIGESANIVVIPNGADVDRFQPRDQREARRRLGLPLKGRIVLSAGRLHESKGFPVLVEAIGALAARLPDLSLVIVGGPDREADATAAIWAAAARLGITDRVRVAGAQPHHLLPDWYNAADLFCLPSSREGSPNVIIEALACGLPCVATAVGDIPALLSDEKVGLLTAPRSSVVADAIAEIFSRPRDRDYIAAVARRRPWATVAAECHRALTDIVKPRATARA
jgi:teichuronic acid biosynthesis glycosyltransferase TuaC